MIDILLGVFSVALFTLTGAICTHAPGLISGRAQWLILAACVLIWTRVVMAIAWRVNE